MSKIRELIMYERRDKDDYSILTAKIEDNGNLMFEGYDIGKFPESFWGDSDYEYWLMVDKDYKDTILLWLIKERFENDSKFREWLNEKGIPSEFDSWV